MRKIQDQGIEKIQFDDIFDTILSSSNPFVLFLNIVKLKGSFYDFFIYMINWIENIFAGENYKDMQTGLMRTLYNSLFNNTRNQLLEDFLIDSKYFDQKLYDRLLGFQGFESKQFNSSIRGLTFKQTLRLLEHIEKNLLKEKYYNGLTNNIRTRLDKLIVRYNQKKENFPKELEKFLDTEIFDFEQRKLAFRYVFTNIIFSYYPQVLMCFYWFLPNQHLNVKNFNYFRGGVSVLNHGIPLHSNNLDVFKKVVIKLESSVFGFLYKPFLYSKIAMLYDFDRNDPKWMKNKFFFLILLPRNYLEYECLRNFVSDLEVYSKGSFLKKLSSCGFWTYILPVILLILAFYLPMGTFFGLLVLYLIALSEIFGNKDRIITRSRGIGVVGLIMSILFMIVGVFVTKGDSFRSGYENTRQFVNVLSAYNTFELFQSFVTAGIYLDISSNDKYEGYRLSKKYDYDYLNSARSFNDVSLVDESNLVSSGVDFNDKDIIKPIDDKSEILKDKTKIEFKY